MKYGNDRCFTINPIYMYPFPSPPLKNPNESSKLDSGNDRGVPTALSAPSLSQRGKKGHEQCNYADRDCGGAAHVDIDGASSGQRRGSVVDSAEGERVRIAVLVPDRLADRHCDLTGGIDSKLIAACNSEKIKT